MSSSPLDSAKSRRPLPAGIQLPAEKKQKIAAKEEEEEDAENRRGVGEEVNESEEEEENRDETIAAGANSSANAHNTPSPSFFIATAAAADPRLTVHSSSSSLPPYLTRVRHARQLVIISSNPRHNQRPYKVGKEMDCIEVIEDGGMVIGHDGKIVAVGKDEEIAEKYDQQRSVASSSSSSSSPSSSSSSSAYVNDLDASNTCILPGLVDGHTHPVWAGDRVHEFAMKLAGATYMDVHKAGGGINFTVRHTRAASESELLTSLLTRLDRALRTGTTVLEAKSGYGLELATELKMLRVIESASTRHPIELVGNFCGAHSIPQGSTAAEATHDVIHKQLPAIIEAKKQGLKTLEFIDVFNEKGIFEKEDTRAILKAGQAAGLSINFHGDELSYIEAAELGAELHATAISHLEHISENGMKLMASSGVVATLLPTTAYLLRIQPPPAKRMIELNVPVALGSDFNPNAYCSSLPFVMNLACVHMCMSLPQALNAATINAAGSLNRAESYGSLSAGKVGDFIMLEAPCWEHIIYQINPPITQVWKRGKRVFKEQETRQYAHTQ